MSSAQDKPLTKESLIEEYGLDSETAERLSKELPNLLSTDDGADQYEGLPCCGETHYEWLMQDSAEDQRLTAEQRKALPDEVFCGPDRSFPVNDCAHYTAALRMLGRYGGPGNKDDIRACIVKRGKKLGCPSAEEKDETRPPEPETKEETHMPEEQNPQEKETKPEPEDTEPPKEESPPEEPPKEEPAKEPPAEPPTEPPAPTDQETEKEDTADIEKMKDAMVRVGVGQETMKKILEEMSDEADASPVKVEKSLYEKLKRKLRREGVAKETIPLVMEPISVDAIDACGAVRDSLDFTLAEDSLSFSDGLLKGKAICAAAMVQDYDGTKILKCPDELKLAVEYARMLPITDGHPESALVRDQKEIKGWTGLLSWNPDKRTIECDFEITNSTLIEKVRDGKRDVSIGFTCEIEQKDGVFTMDEKEEKFDGVQRNIVLNHLAAGIERGRCPSPLCGIKADAPPPGPTSPGGPTPAPKTGKGDPPGSISREVALRAMKYHGLSEEEWDKLTEAERLRLVEQITTKYAAPYPMGKKDDDAEAAFKEARELVAMEKAKMIDSIMDSKPPKPRRYFEDMNLVVLKDIKALLDSKKEGERLTFSDSSKPGEEAINDAYSKLHRKSP